MKPIHRTPSLHQSLIDDLRAAIISGELAPRELYSVADIAAQFGVSRTPVREALLTLAGQGIVKFERNRGVRILEVTMSDLMEVFQLRLLLEPPAVWRATTVVTPELLESIGAFLSGHAGCDR
jgi:DNA-binding GntR family transcriptional regulator